MAAVQTVRGVLVTREGKGRFTWAIGPHPWEFIEKQNYLLTRWRKGVGGGPAEPVVWCMHDAVVYSQAYEHGRKDGILAGHD